MQHSRLPLSSLTREDSSSRGKEQQQEQQRERLNSEHKLTSSSFLPSFGLGVGVGVGVGAPNAFDRKPSRRGNRRFPVFHLDQLFPFFTVFGAAQISSFHFFTPLFVQVSVLRETGLFGFLLQSVFHNLLTPGWKSAGERKRERESETERNIQSQRGRKGFKKLRK